MLLTRSPLSLRPKPEFSLDLHVLSAPPAFVLSQDQTLREDWLGPKAKLDHFELVLKVVSPFKKRCTGKAGPPLNGIASDASGVTGSLVPTPEGEGSRRIRTAEFSKTDAVVTAGA